MENLNDWSFTEPKRFNPSDAPELSDMSACSMTIEGTLVVSPDNKLLNIMRFEKRGYAICYEVDIENHEAPLKYSYCMEFNAARSKFMIKYDPVSQKYLTIANRILDYNNVGRNLLSFMASDDLRHWVVCCDLLDYRQENPGEIGFQYVDFMIEGEDILFLCRTAMNKANNFHDSNYATFHRIADFRSLLK